MTEASATTDPTKLAPPKNPWNRRLIKALKVTGVLLTLTCLGTCYWWCFMGWAKLTDDGLNKLKKGMCSGEIELILGRANLQFDCGAKGRFRRQWNSRQRLVFVTFVSDENHVEKLVDFEFHDLYPSVRGLWYEVTDEDFWKNLNPFD